MVNFVFIIYIYIWWLEKGIRHHIKCAEVRGASVRCII
jgi:hypothetical protein